DAISSWGPTDNLKLNPDIVAPGIEVITTLSSKSNLFKFISGTSFAAPYVSGCIALMYHALSIERAPVHAIRSALHNTATPIASSTNLTNAVSVAHQGAGLINVMKLITQKTFVIPTVIELGDT
ncbi:peptidase S8/S53 domain-containing protein, partial [Syncephalis plumigaleata]